VTSSTDPGRLIELTRHLLESLPNHRLHVAEWREALIRTARSPLFNEDNCSIDVDSVTALSLMPVLMDDAVGGNIDDLNEFGSG